MELALNKSSSCADCCSDCTLMPCCSASACCDVNCGASCGLIPPDPVRYEYQEPEENFVSIDDAKIKGLLWRIGQQQQQKELETKRKQEEERKKREEELKRREAEKIRVEEVIDLDPEDTRHKGLIISAARSLASWNCSINRVSPDIELVPRQEQRIVAQIELSDSEQEEDPQNDQDLVRSLPKDQDQEGAGPKNSQNHDQIITLQSEEEDQEPKKILKRRNTSSRWSAKKRRPYVNRRGRPMYECPACGKKVQSNYNLRRHMMIHTGERPFPCDLCERRFREFSDLKKHRRRHSHDPQYICMICHLGQPLVQDSTRCADCESKNLMIKPQPEDLGNKTGEEQELEDDEEEEDDMEEEDTEELEEQPQPVLPPTLMVTLIPATKTLPETGSSARLPSRPPLPPSCSSANSSSSLSNDGNTSTKPRNRSRRSYPCPLCHRPFGTRHNLKRHYMIHTGEKPFSCSKCRKPFRECSTLKKHMVTHMRDRWYKCLRCPSKFRDYLEYSDHKENHLEQLRSRKSSTYESDEDEDSSVEDWLECCECQQRFTELDAYTAHLKKHDLELYGMSVDDVDEEREDVDVA